VATQKIQTRVRLVTNVASLDDQLINNQHFHRAIQVRLIKV